MNTTTAVTTKRITHTKSITIHEKRPNLSKHNAKPVPQHSRNNKSKGRNQYPPHEEKPLKNKQLNKQSVSAPTTPQQRRTILPVKARRVERRRETMTMVAEALTSSSADSDDSDHAPVQQQKKHEKKRHDGRNRRRSNTADVRSTVYAGPTFNNAPAPSALPIPAFSPTLDIIPTVSKESQELMSLLSPAPLHSSFDSTLSEIQRGLRSMLKI